MGYNAFAIVLIDHLSDIEKEPERFGRRFAEAVNNRLHRPNSLPSHAIETWFGAGSVPFCDHADGFNVFLGGRNCLRHVRDLGLEDLKQMKREIERRIAEAKRSSNSSGNADG